MWVAGEKGPMIFEQTVKSSKERSPTVESCVKRTGVDWEQRHQVFIQTLSNVEPFRAELNHSNALFYPTKHTCPLPIKRVHHLSGIEQNIQLEFVYFFDLY
ncbi:hypothetical protein E3N88_46206 [Mikania micrantha]|uniref:Uncharacterized protein n=1 Tax=Mikania micrantha TaxID=192012 RepID=A0A5N6L6W0_9ASTR|nr:hypothetical protein E3N88_46206 [Mikania micrantha]